MGRSFVRSTVRLAVAVSTVFAAVVCWADTVQASSLAEVQALINAATGPRTILLPPGNFTVTKSIVLKSDITIDGQNSTTLTVPSNLFLDVFMATGTRSSLGSLMTVDESGTAIELSLPAKLNPGDMLFFDLGNGTDGSIHTVAQSGRSGGTFLDQPLPERVSTGCQVYRVDPVQNIVVKNVRTDGANNPVLFDYCKDATIDGVITTHSRNYMFLRRSLNLLVNNSIWEFTGGGPFFLASRNCLAANNVVTKHTRAGIFARSCSEVSVTGNTMQGIPEAAAYGGNGDGLTIVYCDGTEISGNSISNTSCYGMWVLDSQKVTCTSNETSNCLTTSFFFQNVGGAELRDNVASSNLVGYGYTAIGCSDLSVVGNMAYQVPRGYYIVNNIALLFDQNTSLQTIYQDYFYNNSAP